MISCRHAFRNSSLVTIALDLYKSGNDPRSVNDTTKNKEWHGFTSAEGENIFKNCNWTKRQVLSFYKRYSIVAFTFLQGYSVEPRFNKVTGYRPNLLVKWRVRYVENLDIKNLRGKDQNVRCIEVIFNDWFETQVTPVTQFSMQFSSSRSAAFWDHEVH